MKYSKAKIEECADWIEQNGLQDFGGATLKEFCQAMGFHHDTYFKWMRKAEFSEAVTKAKEVFRSSLEKRIVNSLANSALGYEVEEVKSEYVNDLLTGKPKLKKQQRTKKHILPNTGAAIFLLTNIAPDKWKNKMNTEHSGEVFTHQKPLTKEELKELHNRLENE